MRSSSRDSSGELRYTPRSRISDAEGMGRGGGGVHPRLIQRRASMPQVEAPARDNRKAITFSAALLLATQPISRCPRSASRTRPKMIARTFSLSPFPFVPRVGILEGGTNRARPAWYGGRRRRCRESVGRNSTPRPARSNAV